MGEEIAFENNRISDFQGLVTLTLDRVILHTIMHHSSTSTYVSIFIEINETFCVRTDGRMHAWTYIFLPMLLGRLGISQLKNAKHKKNVNLITLYHCTKLNRQ